MGCFQAKQKQSVLNTGLTLIGASLDNKKNQLIEFALDHKIQSILDITERRIPFDSVL